MIFGHTCLLLKTPLIAFVLLPVSLSPAASLPLMKLPTSRPPPSCLPPLAPRPASPLRSWLSLRSSLSVLLPLRSDFSIHPPPPFCLTVLKPFFLSCFYSTFVTLLARRLVSPEPFLASHLHSFVFTFFFLSHMWKVGMLLTCAP